MHGGVATAGGGVAGGGGRGGIFVALPPHTHVLTMHFLPLLPPRRGCHLKEA